MLESQAAEQLAEHGYCLFLDVLSPAEVVEARERLDAVVDVNSRNAIPTFRQALDPNPQNVRVFNLMAADDYFLELVRHPKAMEVASHVLQGDVMVSSFTANIARPGARSMKVHSDQSVVIPEPWFHPWTLNVVFCLSDIRKENGATLFLPGSHHYKTRSEVPDDALSRMVPFEAPAGSIIAMDGRLWHTSGENVTQNEDRALLFAYYTRSFISPQLNPHALLSPEKIRELDDEMLHLLGLSAGINTTLADTIHLTSDVSRAGVLEPGLS